MEKTIEQRAAIIAVEIIANAVQVIEHKDAETLQGIKNYIARELEKQRKIDIEKACEWLKRELDKLAMDKVDEDFLHNEFRVILKEDVSVWVDDFRKAMEG